MRLQQTPGNICLLRFCLETEWGEEKELISTQLSSAKPRGLKEFAQPHDPSEALALRMKIMIFIGGTWYALLLHIQSSLNGYFKTFPMGKIGHVKMPGIQLSLPPREKRKKKKANRPP